MRLCLVTLALSLAMAAAADTSASIPLRHVSAADALTLVMRSTGQSGLRAPDSADTLPDGARTLSADGEQNALLVTGTDAGIEAVRNIVRLVDIPQQRVLLSVRAVDAGAAMLTLLRTQSGGAAEGGLHGAALDAKTRNALIARGGPWSVTRNAFSNSPVYLRHPWHTLRVNGSPYGVVTARVNGDENITLLVSLDAKDATREEFRAGKVRVGLRVSAEQAVAVWHEDQPGVVLIVSARSVERTTTDR
jgi:hypothetical protein